MIRIRSLLLLGAIASFLTDLTLAQGPGEVHELLGGSTITDECVFCDRAPIVKPLRGSFKLTQIPSFVCCVYEISELSFATPDGDYTVVGAGLYTTNHIGEVTQQLGLSVTINAAEAVELTGGPVKINVPAPVIEITVTEDGQRDPSHKYTITLVSAPSREHITYDLVAGKEGSRLNIQCNACELLFDEVPLMGSFRLSRVSEGANPVSLFVVDFIEFRNTPDFQLEPFLITGYGTYEHGGEVALTQQISLNLTINHAMDRRLESGRGPVHDGVVFPNIAIDCEEPPTDTFRYSLFLVARPGTSNLEQFRRADANADGKVDISDPVSILNWLFSGGPTPTCLDAGDANLDARIDLADAVFTLLFLFQGGESPARPGATTCGFPEQPQLGCQNYDACDV